MVNLEEKKISNLENECCCSNGFCIESSKIPNKDLSDQSKESTNKLQVDIYVPLNECACLWDQFMNKVFEVLTPYMKHITFNTKNVNSEEARQLKVLSKSIIINGGEKRFTSAFTLQKELPQILHEKGFI